MIKIYDSKIKKMENFFNYFIIRKNSNCLNYFGILLDMSFSLLNSASFK